MHRWIILILIATVLLDGAPLLRAQVISTPTASAGDFAGLVDIGDDRRIYLECRGSGSPTVILEAGFRTRADVWSDDLVQPDAPRTMVFQGVAKFTRVCAYDRPGTATVLDDGLHPSRSDPVTMPRNAELSVADLHALLAAAEIPGPYVLVGHSYGGMLVRLFAAEYPDEVAGMVLVDAFSEHLKVHLTPAQWTAYDGIFQPVPPALNDYAALEFTELDRSVEQVRAASQASPPREMPLVVLSRGQAMAMPSNLPGGLTGALLEGAWTASQSDLAALLPDARHEIALESEHYIQLQQPELVIAAVRAVVDAVRDPASWSRATPVAPPAHTSN